ncbi:uncharacterized protein BDZ99DRAFT_454275 [Mytilinidion resinicola]|uniref:Aminoglycoside phosphotransferase domain-containing protein n=1 Tax=Mytilinidion resinicola TaxID=574789 RepID=A0A6A6Y2W2_9PEZI|nr:uncharacterized protein BDZ99DRAFT_454275 [Mytilinidion resinicola]KAF2802979.1 hypothetical protein BDZ99DRAFT_454275 [Mytilinidion resinicola]
MTLPLPDRSTKLPLLHGNTTLSGALDQDSRNILFELDYPQKQLDFFFYLWEHQKDLEKLVSFHLGVPTETCKVAEDFREWVRGSFNACIPVYIDDNSDPTSSPDDPRRDPLNDTHLNDTHPNPVKKVFIRFPLPYKVGESPYPGNAEEKLRCEVGTYIWIESNCPDIPIPYLRGFGFSDGQSFTVPENASLSARIAWSFRRAASWLFGYPAPSRYIRQRSPVSMNTGYMIVDCVTEGEMLSVTWDFQRRNKDRRTNLFTGLSRIMLSLARVPLPRIGSFTIDNDGVLSLTNRPLTCTLQQLENYNIPTEIPRNLTYVTTDAYLLDLLACHDNRIRYMPNSILDIADGQEQLSALTMMRALVRHFTNRKLRSGPFFLMLTDLHQSNIFVNRDWHITSIIDLEWACVLPIEMQHPPYWLTGASIDRLVGEELEAFESVHAEFMAIFEEEEQRSFTKDGISHSRIMRNGWETGNFWYFSALDCLNGLYHLYISHIQGIFAPMENSEFNRTVSAYWTRHTEEFLREKVRDQEEYSNCLRKRFAAEVDK